MNLETSLKIISNTYGSKVAVRSGVPLINHITEGLKILEYRGADENTKSAFALHPIFQSDLDLSSRSFNGFIENISSKVMLLVMEYRNIANGFLSNEMLWYDKTTSIKLSPLKEVNEMLVADKVQNKKDFVKYNFRKIDNSEQLLSYFNLWLKALNIDKNEYRKLALMITE